MNKVASRVLQRYTTEELNESLDKNQAQVQVEELVAEVSKKKEELARKEKEIMSRDEKIHRLAVEIDDLKKQVKHYEDIEEDLSKTKQIVETTSLKIQVERDELLAEAKKNADRIVNEALLNAEKTEMEANLLKRNIKLLKNKMKQLINEQIEQENEK